MKKRTMSMLLTSVLVLGLSGILIQGKGTVSENEQLVQTLRKETIVGLEPGDIRLASPIIEGEKDWEVYQGEEIDVLVGVTARNYADQDLEVTASSFLTDEVGSQEVVLTTEDKFENKTTVTITVDVKPLEVIEEQVNDNNIEEKIIKNSAEKTKDTAYEEVATTKVVQKSPQKNEVVPSEPIWEANTMYLGGIAIYYQNAGQGSGQGVIDSNPNIIATWGGAAYQSATDGANTHFIGHNPGIFNILFYLGYGSEIIVTDGAGVPSVYLVNQIFQADNYGIRTDNGQNVFDEIAGSGGGERITLQTCVNDDINLIVMASIA